MSDENKNLKYNFEDIFDLKPESESKPSADDDPASNVTDYSAESNEPLLQPVKINKKKKLSLHQKIDLFFVAVLGLVFIFCAFKIGFILYGYYAADKLYTSAEDSFISEEKDDVSGADITLVDFEALKAINPEVVAWLVVDDTDISYPVVQGEDNDKYLSLAYDLTKNSSGSIFMNTYNKPDLSDSNTLIYGHHMRNGSMFGGLMDFEDPDYLNTHRTFAIYTPMGTKYYQIFSAFVTYSASFVYTDSFEFSWDFYDWLVQCKDSSILDMGVELSQDDKVVTLSTCTSRGNRAERFVVQGKLLQQ